MEDAEVIDVLHISLLKVQRGTVFLRQEMQGIQGLGLRFGDGGDVRGPGLGLKAGEIAPRVLNEDAIWGRVGGGLEIQQGSLGVGSSRVVEPLSGC